MKTILTVILLFCFTQSFSQSLSFTNPTRKSGDDLKKGAVYLFKNVTTGVNAEVTISDLVNGATVTKIDDNGGGVGYEDAFQPEIKSGSKGESYAVFTVKFIEKTSGSLYLLQKLQATALDIDGTSELKEFDEIDMNGGTAVYMGGTPQISLKSLPIIGSLLKNYRADNITGVDKNGIDTSSKGNMYTVTNTNINQFKLKLGATTSTNSKIERQYSIYMKGFQYPNLAILPLKLLSFTAEANNNKALLNWKTTEEERLSSFIVERSVDGINFSAAGTVAAKGSFTATTSYTFSETLLNASKIFYRLRSVNTDGSYAFSPVQVIAGKHSNVASLAAYPNPFTNSITINLAGNNSQSSVEFFNANGQLIKAAKTSASKETIETSAFEKGIYLVRVKNGEAVSTIKIIKN